MRDNSFLFVMIGLALSILLFQALSPDEAAEKLCVQNGTSHVCEETK